MKEHFNWRLEHNQEDRVNVKENYDGFIASYEPSGLDHMWDTMIENMDFCDDVGLCKKRPGSKIKVDDSQFHLHQKGYHFPDSGAEELYNVAEAYLNVCNVKYVNFIKLCLEHYKSKFDVLEHFDLHPFAIKIQKTKPGQGFHIWHCEQGTRHTQKRVIVFMTYLNDDFEGGETEFLYQCKRIKPKKGKTLLWPADYTHTHRGLMPLKGTKYIATGWFDFGDFGFD